MEIDKNLEKLKEKIEPRYRLIKEVYCPYFREKVQFNSKGIRHIKFKKEGVARFRQDQYIRLKYLMFAPEIIKSSYTLQEIRESRKFVEIKTNKRKETILKKVVYYGFVAIVNHNNKRKRFKIIVKQVEGGVKFFWSVIPYWKSNKELKLHVGNPEED